MKNIIPADNRPIRLPGLDCSNRFVVRQAVDNNPTDKNGNITP
jgi:hypothetical protein